MTVLLPTQSYFTIRDYPSGHTHLFLFRQVIGIPMGTNCAPLLADLFLYSYENEFLDNMIRSGHRRLARSFNLCYRYIDDLIVFNNKKSQRDISITANC